MPSRGAPTRVNGRIRPLPATESKVIARTDRRTDRQTVPSPTAVRVGSDRARSTTLPSLFASHLVSTALGSSSFFSYKPSPTAIATTFVVFWSTRARASPGTFSSHDYKPPFLDTTYLTLELAVIDVVRFTVIVAFWPFAPTSLLFPCFLINLHKLQHPVGTRALVDLGHSNPLWLHQQTTATSQPSLPTSHRILTIPHRRRHFHHGG